ncbi:MAG: hypothetical protein ACK5L7_00560 [Paludibacteraceae bacterium]
MKRYFVLFGLFVVCGLSLQAQSNALYAQIERVPDGELTWIKLTVTNRSGSPIIITDMCRLSTQGREIGYSSSFVTAIANDKNGTSIGKSSNLSFLSFGNDSGAYLRNGESDVQVFLLHTKEISGFFSSAISERSIGSLQLKVHLIYKRFIPNGIATFVEDIYSNTLIM